MGSSTTQGELWGLAAHDWAELQEPLHMPLWEAMLDAVRAGQDTRFFDAGCGSGGASVLAAQRGARIAGLDASEALIAIARRRVPQGDFRVGDLEEAPYDAGAFDGVMACLSVQYAADPIAALRELMRVCASGGILAVSTWGRPDQCEQRVVLKAVRDTLPSPPPGDGPFALSDDGALESLLEQAGWNVFDSGGVDCPFTYPDLETCWQAQRSAGGMQANIPVAGEERMRSAVEQAVAPYQTRAGGVRLENRFRYVAATP